PHYEEAAQLLERARKAGSQDGRVSYLLGLAYKRQGKLGEARDAFRKVNPPGANVHLQLGLLALQEDQYAQAEEEFGRALALDGASYAACYNLLMTRLTLGKLAECAGLAGRAAEMAEEAEDRRLLGLLLALLVGTQTGFN